MKARTRWALTLLLTGALAGHASAQEAPVISLPSTEVSENQSPAVLPRELRLDVTVPASAASVLVFVPLSAGQAAVPGSASYAGEALDDSAVSVSPTGVYLRLPGGTGGTLALTLTGLAPDAATPAAALQVRYAQGQTEALQGRMDPTDLASAKPLTGTAPERAAPIRSPQDGLTLRDRRTVNVSVDLPLGQGPENGLKVNGVLVPETRIGKRTLYQDGHSRYDYVAVPLEIGTNLLTAYGDTVTVTAAGPAASVQITPRGTLVADGSTPLVFDLNVQDAQGNGSDVPSVSVTTEGSEPQDTDSDAQQSGYQVAVTRGRATLTLRPLSVPGPVRLTFDVNGHAQTTVYPVQAGGGTVIVAHAGGVISGGLPGTARFQGAGSIEAPIADGKLYVAADSQGVNRPLQPFERYGAYGDASIGKQPLAAQGKVALKYVSPELNVNYGQDAALDPVFGVHTGADGLNLETVGDLRFGGSLTQVPGNQLTAVLIPNGTRLLNLPGALIPGSETLVLVTSDGSTELSRRTLVRGADYVASESGLIEFPAPFLPVDAQGHQQRLLVSYRSLDQGGTSNTTAGVHLTRHLDLGNASTFDVSAGALLQVGVPAFGVHATLTAPQGGADVLIGASGGALLEVVSGTYAQGKTSASLSFRNEGAGYTGPGASSPGLNVNAAATYALSPSFALKATASGSQALTTAQDGTVVQNGTVSAAFGVAYTSAPWRAELLARRNFTASLFGLQGLVGYTAGGYDLSVSHAQDFGGTQTNPGQSLSTATASVPITNDVKFGVTVTRDWNSGVTQAGLALTGTRAGVTYVAGYDLPSEGGPLGRARLAATTSIPLARGLYGDLAAGVSTDTGLSGSLGATLRYQDTVTRADGSVGGTQATLGADAAFSPTGTTFDVKGVITVSYGLEWTYGADLLSTFGGSEASGIRAGLNVAWRGDSASALGYLRYRSGAFGEDRLTAELNLEQHPDFRSRDTQAQDLLTAAQRPVLALRQNRLELRESFAAAVPLGGAAPTLQGLGLARYWTTDRLAFGVQGGLAYQPGADLASLFGVEASYSFLPGWALTAGYNILGFDSDLGTQPTKKGAYLKFDLMFDEIHK